MSERFRFIDAEKAYHNITTLCRVLEVSRSGYYAWRERSPSKREKEDRKLLAVIRKIHDDARGRYGAPRIWRALLRQGVTVGRHRVARLMREHQLFARRRRRFKATTDSKHNHRISPNLLQRNFETQAPDQVWVGDITYIHTKQGWLYLAVLIDLFSRRVVGWAMSDRIDQKLTLSALRMAFGLRQPAPGLIHHSDRGSQYAANSYRRELQLRGARSSMSRKGDCWDNAVAESFFGALKAELVHEVTFLTHNQARREVLQYLLWYSAHRLHSYIDYQAPMEFEKNSLTHKIAA